MAKEVVEDCLSFLVSDVLARRSGRFSGTIVWSWIDGRECSIRYETDWDAETPRVTLWLFRAFDATGIPYVRIPGMPSQELRERTLLVGETCEVLGDHR
jgi:hypothetical protein